MANIIVTSKNTDIDNYYYPDFINVIINNGEFVIPRSNDKVCIEDTKDYVNCALSIITCIRSVREQVYITGECNVY